MGQRECSQTRPGRLSYAAKLPWLHNKVEHEALWAISPASATQPLCSDHLSQLHSLCAVNVCHSTLHRAKALSFPWREEGELEHIHRIRKPQWRTNKLEPQTAMCVDIKSWILILGGKSSMFWYAWGLHTHGMSPFLKHTKVGWDQIRYIPSLLTAEPIFQTWRHVKSLIWYFHQL